VGPGPDPPPDPEAVQVRANSSQDHPEPGQARQHAGPELLEARQWLFLDEPAEYRVDSCQSWVRPAQGAVNVIERPPLTCRQTH
jgi:hypothetical protein